MYSLRFTLPSLVPAILSRFSSTCDPGGHPKVFIMRMFSKSAWLLYRIVGKILSTSKTPVFALAAPITGGDQSNVTIVTSPSFAVAHASMVTQC
jgi:hypothetical protein